MASIIYGLKVGNRVTVNRVLLRFLLDAAIPHRLQEGDELVVEAIEPERQRPIRLKSVTWGNAFSEWLPRTHTEDARRDWLDAHDETDHLTEGERKEALEAFRHFSDILTPDQARTFHEKLWENPHEALLFHFEIFEQKVQ